MDRTLKSDNSFAAQGNSSLGLGLAKGQVR
jgi:hypothetical protein